MENIDNFDYYIFGCGISGATLARKLINQNKDLKILIFEKREHIGGNVYDFKDRYGIMVHKYGPHIFHTNDDIVINFIKNYANWKQFRHKVNVKVKDIEVPLPINFKSIDLLFPEEANEIKEKLKKEFKNEEKTFIFDLISSENSITKKFGEFIYKNIFENYSKKMWGQDPTKLDKNILKRIPIILSYDDGYFTDKFQAIPEKGYTQYIKKLIDDKNIKIILNSNFNDLKIINNKTYIYDQEITKPIIYTGLIDKLFNYKFGKLNYRSINFKFENLKIDSFQNRSVTNYPADLKMTRITEYKKLLKQKNNKEIKGITTIGKEYPGQYSEDSKEFNIPCYPIYTKNELENYSNYLNESKKIKNLFFLGRLSEYKYKQMWQATKDALEFKF